MNEKIVIIGGGVGPLAGVEFHKRLIAHTAGDGSDQDHLDVIHISRSHDIANRINFLSGKSSENPAEGMFRSIEMVAAGIGGRDAVIAIPCNTYHIPLVFDRFLELLNTAPLNYDVIHIIDEVIAAILELKTIKKVGLLSTVMAKKYRLFHDPLEAHELSPIDLAESDHEAIQDCIWKIKEDNVVAEETRQQFQHYVNRLAAQGAEIVIAGCSEVSLIFDESVETEIPVIDPLDTLARATIKNANPAKLKGQHLV
jgi:aspartate racemase